MNSSNTSSSFKEDKLRFLNRLVENSKLINKKSALNPTFKERKILVERTFLKLFGQDSLEVREFKKIKFRSDQIEFSIAYEDAMQHVEAFNRGFETVKRMINQYIEDVQEENENTTPLLQTKIDSKEALLQASSKKIKWMGTQKELGELFIELSRKGWIDEINSDLIQNYFSDSNTIKQVLKPSKDKNGMANYDGVYTKAYKPKFDLIRLNEKIR